MTRAQFYKEIAARSGIPKDTVAAIITEEENLVYEIMATCDSIKYIWGTVMGVEKAPKRIGGMYRELDAIKRNGGWSNWKLGYPQIKWARVSKVCDTRSPAEYFEQPEKRYLSAARTFRKDAGLPEILEFEGLSEEKIAEICKKADEIEFNALTGKEKFNKSRDKKHNTIKKKALIEYWNKIGYIPQGALYNEELGDANYQGEQRDTIDQCLSTRLAEAQTLPEKLEAVLFCQDLAEFRNYEKPHPELKELEKQFREEIEKQGLTPIRHVKKNFERQIFSIKYNGEVDPWGTIRKGRNKKKREKERQEQFEQLDEEIKESNQE